MAPWGNLRAEPGTYDTRSYDWQTTDFISSTVASGASLAGQWAAIVQCANTINQANLQYQPLGQNSNSAVAQCLLQAGIDIPNGLLAYTNGQWTPSDSDGLFNNPVSTPGSGGVGGSGEFYSGIGGQYYSFGDFSSGHWVYARVDGNGGWRWVDDSFAVRVSPIVIDLDSDGLELSSITERLTFDWNCDGYRQSTGWIKGSDAFLVYDNNLNGIVDNGTEIAMTAYSPGAPSDLEALRVFDTNGDSVLSGADTDFSKFGLWIDGNNNGNFESGEMTSLLSQQIQSISLTGVLQDQWVDLNHYSAVTPVGLNNGTQINAYDVGISASARGSQFLGSFTTSYGIYTWQAVKVSSGELVVSYNQATGVSINVDDIIYNGQTPTGFLTGSGDDNLYVGGYRQVGGVWIDGPRSEGVLIETGVGSDYVNLWSTANNYVSTGDGNDIVMGGSGNDIITLGKNEFGLYGIGGDNANGGAGDDMFRIQRDGSYSISDASGSNDAIVILDVLLSEVSVGRQGNSLSISSFDGRFSAQVLEFFSPGDRIESIVFQDGELFASNLITQYGGLSALTSLDVESDIHRSNGLDFSWRDAVALEHFALP